MSFPWRVAGPSGTGPLCPNHHTATCTGCSKQVGIPLPNSDLPNVGGKYGPETQLYVSGQPRPGPEETHTDTNVTNCGYDQGTFKRLLEIAETDHLSDVGDDACCTSRGDEARSGGGKFPLLIGLINSWFS